MNHSHHVGFSGPPATAFIGALRALSLGQSARVASVASKLSSFFSAVANPSPLLVLEAVSVGSSPTLLVLPSARRRRTLPVEVTKRSSVVELAPVLLASNALRVGSNDPDSISLVGGTHGVRAEHAPLRIEPHRGQVTKDDSESSSSESWGVLHEDVSGFHLANNAGEV
jgi:hypothetical protein